uniref:GyrI-like domain-containing protein n=1 Tax=Paenibacillus terrae TaxID=159743 RepID=UPI0011AA18FA|nr:effector binding domain-containing protein [Paenibacillus terrae]
MKLHLINSTRTNNFNDPGMMGKIQAIWNEASGKVERHRDMIYGIYYDYDSNYTGDYSLSVATENVPGDTWIEIPDDATYEVFTVDTADEMGIVKTWRSIWEKEEAGALRRAYTYDYEKYHPGGEIEIYIAVK